MRNILSPGPAAARAGFFPSRSSPGWRGSCGKSMAARTWSWPTTSISSAGTSTGAIIAAALSWGADVATLEKFYLEQSYQVFGRKTLFGLAAGQVQRAGTDPAPARIFSRSTASPRPARLRPAADPLPLRHAQRHHRARPGSSPTAATRSTTTPRCPTTTCASRSTSSSAPARPRRSFSGRRRSRRAASRGCSSTGR